VGTEIGRHAGGSSGSDLSVERMRISPGGNIGIRTTSPQTAMHIQGTGANDTIFITNSSAVSSSAKTFLTGKGANAILMPQVGNTADIFVYFNDSSGTPRLTWINSAGTVGAGTLFTGQHLTYTNEINAQEHEGLIVCSDGTYQSYDKDNQQQLPNNMFINECLPFISLTTSKNQKNVFGVVTTCANNPMKQPDGTIIHDYDPFDFERDLDNRVRVNSVGEGGIWVCNDNGNLENGDYITTSSLPGYGMRQDDDVLHNYTVAKMTCDCDFDNLPEWIKTRELVFNSKIFKCAFVGCTYHCG
jgi:hypothetical protein